MIVFPRIQGHNFQAIEHMGRPLSKIITKYQYNPLPWNQYHKLINTSNLKPPSLDWLSFQLLQQFELYTQYEYHISVMLFTRVSPVLSGDP